MSANEKTVVLLGRRDHTEAMRVAAGLTIFGHRVKLVFMGREVADTEENRAQAELLELSDIEPVTTVPDAGLPMLTTGALAELIAGSDVVLSV
ncbi:MAG TPA: hypothetical protein VKA14_05900 [Gammaproteobacteria bacterium]|nr:hypothetical protein [Gammaproteobacteria bacterium]